MSFSASPFSDVPFSAAPQQSVAGEVCGAVEIGRPEFPRPVPDTYRMWASPTPASEPQSGIGLVSPDRADPPRRATGTAYDVWNGVPPGEFPTPGVVFPASARSPRRAAGTEYGVSPPGVSPSEHPLPSVAYPDRVRGPKRAGYDGYDVRNGVPPAERTDIPVATVTPAFARPPRRAANTAYELSPPRAVTPIGVIEDPYWLALPGVPGWQTWGP